MHFSAVTIAAFMTFVGRVVGECKFDIAIPPDQVDYDFKSEDLCTKQKEGVYTFSMASKLTVFPTFDSADVWAGKVEGAGFILFDNNCVVKDVYPKPTKCSIPYWLESQWLDYDIKVTKIDTIPAASKYRFAYGSGSYGNGENDCHCKSKTRGLQGYSECRCPFPLNGDGSKI